MFTPEMTRKVRSPIELAEATWCLAISCDRNERTIGSLWTPKICRIQLVCLN